MKSTLNKLSFFVKYLLISTVVMSLFRVLLLILSHRDLAQIPHNEVFDLIFNVLCRGIRFDVSILCYALILPYIFYKIAVYTRLNKILIFWTLFLYMLVLQIIIIFFLCADIPLFLYSGNRITIDAFQWISTPKIVFKMIFEDSFYIIFLVLFLIYSFISGYYLYKALKVFSYKIPVVYSLKKEVLIILISVLLLFWGSRSKLNGTAIKLKDSIISEYVVPNKITLNPVFNFLRSWLDRVVLMDDKLAIQQSISIMNSNRLDVSPLAREIESSKPAMKKNIVIVIMESMSANNLAHYGNKNSLTPCLDSIAEKSLCFDNFYSSGIHTNCGIFSVLFSYPAFWRVRPLNAYADQPYTGFSGTLKKNGYNTIFFTTQGKTFDNIYQFIPNNNFDELVCQDNYPSDQLVNSFGVSDHVQFQYAIEKLNQLSEKKAPFFASILTSSNHPPLVLPKNISFKPSSKDEILAEVQYADWSIKDFLERASKQKWFDSTVFVFVGDHGCNQYESNYDMYLSFNHIPLLIYSPSLLAPKHYRNMAGQIDIYPTLLGILNFSYLNNTAGVDVIKTPRPYIFFSADDKMGCIDEEYLYVFRQNKTESLYKYRSSDKKNYMQDYKNKVDSMKYYAFSLIQASQWCILNKRTGFK